MLVSKRGAQRAVLVLSCALGAFGVGSAAWAQAPAAAPAATDSTAVSDVVVTISRTTRSSVALNGAEMQKLLPGVNPLKAIETLPGVLFETADPWGNNEQNEVLYVHGFSTQQLGYTMDGVPLGDQQYGNYNGLSVSRAVTSENVSKVLLSSGAGDIGVASTSNLGGTIQTFSYDPEAQRGVRIDETVGSYDTTRTYLRLDTGDLGAGNAGYFSYVHQDARAWDFDGHQKDDQVNVKFVHKDEIGKLTLFFDWSDKVEPNEDATQYPDVVAGTNYTPYTRPFLYPNLAEGLAYLTNGAPPANTGNNFTNYYSAAQRTDYLGYGKYDWTITSNLTFSNTAYYHHDEGRGLVAGPVNQAGLPTLFAIYYPQDVVGGSATSAGTVSNLVNVFGGTGYEVRETEYLINRGGLISSLDWKVGGHDVEAGLWWEHVNSQTDRNWFAFNAASNDLTPYDVPVNPLFTQYESRISNNVVVTHLQDQWRVLPSLLLQAGFKSSLQFAYGKVPIQQDNNNLPAGALPNFLPTGEIDTLVPFLPQVGAVWDFTSNDQLFFNVQKNVRQFITYGASGLSPWSLGSQAAFNQFKATAQPETSWTYETGVRGHHTFDFGPLTAIEGQFSLYHVDFANRLLQVNQFNFINPNPSILANVGSVITNGVDLAGTLHFGSHVSLYDAVSYNKSTYGANYTSANSTGTSLVTVDTKGKWVLDSPDWLNKTVAGVTFGNFEGQLIGDYVGRRYATYLNDLYANPYFTLELEASYRLPPVGDILKSPKISLHITNLTNTKGISSFGNTNASGSYTAYPLPPIQGFLTVSAKF
jgi:hypothetical protein